MNGQQRQSRFLDVEGCRQFLLRILGTAWIAATSTLAALPLGRAFGEDWPTYRHDAARSGITAEEIRPPLQPCWVFKAGHAPQPAWGDPKPGPVEDILELRRVHFDDVFQPVVAGQRVYFGSSADNKVSCLDAGTGELRWTKTTGGPVRLAPMVARGRVYVGSDDGYAYCLDAGDGSLIWKFHAAPEDRRVLGHGKMISLWPVRTGVLVDRGVAYFGAGIFPASGVFLYAVEAVEGRQLWRNDTCGEPPLSRVSPQGYLLASRSSLYVPMGRVSPAAFDRRDGRMLHPSPFFGKTVGGTYALLAGEEVYTGTEQIVGYRSTTPDRFATFPGRKMVVTDEVAYLASDTQLAAMDRQTPADEAVRWKVPSSCADSLILAGEVLFAGGDGQVVAFDAASGEQIWKAEVSGKAKGLAAAEGRLLVSTDRGMIHCFGPRGSPQHGLLTEPIREDPFPGSRTAAMFRQAAETILEETAIRRGFCLVLGLETGELALELARGSELTIYAVSPDAAKVAAARKALDAAGLHGARVVVERWPLAKVPYADYFANLIVSETAMIDAGLPGDAAEMCRMLKPLGGTAMIGQPVAMADSAQRLAPEALEAWSKQEALRGAERVERIQRRGTWLKIVRGPLPGAGSWTHQYADAGNTACGDDVRVRCPLGVLWFGHPGPGQMVNRHARAAGPLSLDGRLFVQGENTVMAYDVYNGVKLWQRDIPGATRTPVSHESSNLALSGEGLFVAIEDHCLRLDPATGETKATYRVPPREDDQPSAWGYVACADKQIFGSRSSGRYQSDCVFAVDVETGEHRWVQPGKQIPHNTIAIGDGKVFFVSSDVPDEERAEVIRRKRSRLGQLPAGSKAEAEAGSKETDVRRVVALDVETGRVRWQRAVDVTHCGGWHAALQRPNAEIASMYHDGVLVLFGMYLDGHYWKQFFAGEFGSRRILALSGHRGETLWSRQVGFRVRPLIVGDTLHAEPWAFDLHTGEPRTRIHPVTGQPDPWQFARPGHHCGCPCASPNCLFFRSYALGYYDLPGDYGTMHFGAQRPGCWINTIPAGGLLLVPEASAGCMCPFPNMCSVAFQPVEKTKGWAYYSAPGPMTPVRRLGLNLGAPGDRNDAEGRLWLGYPRPGGWLVLAFDADISFYPGGRFETANSVYAEIDGTKHPWLFASAALGLRKCSIPLLGEADGRAAYRVRLAMADPDNQRPGRRVFDIKLQGKVVAEDFDLVEAAGGRRRAVVREFEDVEVEEKLVIELVAKADNPLPDQMPILQAVEIVRQRMLSLGCAVPEFLVCNSQPRQSGQLQVGNLREEAFAGTLRVVAPDGFQVAPQRAQLKLAPGQHKTIPLEVSVNEDVPAGNYRLTVRLVRSEGTPELEKTARVEHLGPRARAVLRAVEDAHVSQRYPDRNQGKASMLLVDGGNDQMGDRDHALAYLRFRLDVPGKPLSARLRIHNAGNPSGDSGRVCLVTEPWTEDQVTYRSRPKPGKELVRLGRVEEHQVVECPLNVELRPQEELSLVIEPTSCDGVDYVSRQGDRPPELIVEYQP